MSNTCTPDPASTGVVTSAPPREFRPHVDSFEGPEGLILEVDLPGATEKTLALELDGAVLTVTAPRPASRSEGDVSPRWREIEDGIYKRAFRLPDGLDLEAIQASLTHGVLRIVFPRSAAKQPRTIAVQAG